MNHLEKLAKSISSKDVSLVFEGSGAYSDGKKIVLPSMTTKSLEKKEVADALRGYCDHELGHVLFTDFEILKGLDKATKNALNQIEDLRVERLMIDKYIGMRANLESTVHSIYEKYGKSLDRNNPLHWMGVEGRKRYGIRYSDLDGDYSAKIAELYGGDFLDRVDRLKSTREALDLAKEIVNQGSEDSDSEDSDSEDSEDSDSGPENSDSENSGSENSEDSGPENSEDSGHSPIEDHENIFDKLKGEIESKANDLDGYRVASTKYDEIKYPDTNKLKGLHLIQYNQSKKEISRLNVIKQKMIRLFKSSKASKWQYGMDEGKVNPRALAKVKAGNRSVFKQKYVAPEVNTAATFLIDYSGSMAVECRIIEAKKAAIIFMETLEAAGVKTEVLGYTTNGKTPKDINHKDVDKYGRAEGLLTYIVKSFDERLSSEVKARLYADHAMLNNADSESVRIAYDRISTRPEKRKILFVLTDGDVACYGNIKVGKKELKRVVSGIEKAGRVEIIGIDFFSGNTSKTYSNVIEIQTGDSLSEKILFGVSKLLK